MDSPTVERIIVMAKNEVGVLADITAAMAEAEVNILTVNTESTGEDGPSNPDNRGQRPRARRADDGGFQGDHRRRAGHQAAGRAGRARQGGGEVQELGREYPEPAHPRPPRRVHDSGAIRQRPRESGDAGGERVDSLITGCSCPALGRGGVWRPAPPGRAGSGKPCGRLRRGGG